MSKQTPTPNPRPTPKPGVEAPPKPTDAEATSEETRQVDASGLPAGLFPTVARGAPAHRDAVEVEIAEPGYVDVPGVRAANVTELYLDGAFMPRKTSRWIPMQNPGEEPQSVEREFDQYALADWPDGFGVRVYRSQLSNDGVWQVGSKLALVAPQREGGGS